MLKPKKSGLVIYAKELQRLVIFYSEVLALSEGGRDNEHVLLLGDGIDLVILQPRAHITNQMQVSDPPTRRENVALKPVFYVSSINAARKKAALLGGEIFAADREWMFHDMKVCDGYDPEGNVFQLRQDAASSMQHETH